MRVYLVGQCITTALQVLYAQALNLVFLLPLFGIEHGDVADKRAEGTQDEELGKQGAAQKVGTDAVRSNPVGNGCKPRVGKQRIVEVAGKAFLKLCIRQPTQIIASQQTNQSPEEKETVGKIPIKARTNSPEFYIPREAGYVGIYDENRTNQADQRQFTAYVGIK